ncbi:hypothetical protein PAMA_003657 [Pampus argenteus]
MELSCWINLWLSILLRGISADPALLTRYFYHDTEVSFDQAVHSCSPGILTTLATKQEVAEIHRLISSVSLLKQNRFTFWVGLKKAKNQCVVPTLPLRGFKWVVDGSEETQMTRWKEEPEETCTTVRCAALTGEFNGSSVSSWGLIPFSCRTKNQFICQQRDGQTVGRPENGEADVKPAVPKAEAATPEHAVPETKPTAPESKPTVAEPEIEQGPNPGPESDLCLHPFIPSARSLSLVPENSSRIRVECWSSVQLELHCSGYPAVWRLLDDSPANFTTVCLPCGDGFRKDASGNCKDIDECSGSSPCRHICLNMEGSYKCVCSDQDGKHHDEDSQICMEMAAGTEGGILSGILIPVLVAVAVLVVLVVVVVVTVKYFLMRQSKKHAMKKAEKITMDSKDSKDSFETANEKAT